jgi:hypothetical protein
MGANARTLMPQFGAAAQRSAHATQRQCPGLPPSERADLPNSELADSIRSSGDNHSVGNGCPNSSTPEIVRVPEIRALNLQVGIKLACVCLSGSFGQSHELMCMIDGASISRLGLLSTLPPGMFLVP